MSGKQAEDAAVAIDVSQRSMSRMLAVAGHDLMQPVSVAMLSIERAVDEGIPAGASYRLNVALDALNRLAGELKDIARLSQMNASLAPRLKAVSVAEVLARVERDWGFYAEVCGIDLQVGTSELFAYTDPDMLHSIVRNLVWNALKYCGPKGHVVVNCRLDHDRLRIEVEDDGSGIPASRLDGIFNAFERGDEAGRSDGLGLGLTIVRQTADLLRHPICVQSVENEGSVFSVELPLHLPENDVPDDVDGSWKELGHAAHS